MIRTNDANVNDEEMRALGQILTPVGADVAVKRRLQYLQKELVNAQDKFSANTGLSRLYYTIKFTTYVPP